MSPPKIVLRFTASISDKPIIYHLVKDYNLVVNIVRANINPHKEGMLILELSGEKYQEGLEYLRGQGVTVQPLTQEIVRNEDRCSSCGACTAICPSGALFIERPEMEVKFDSDKCIVCQLCIKICPLRAMEVKF